jgi:hypothetical protein
MSHPSYPRDPPKEEEKEVGSPLVLAVRAAISRKAEKESEGRKTENQLYRPTVDVYGELQRQFDYLNDVVIEPTFGVRLPQVIFTLARTRRFVAAFFLRPWGRKNQDGTYAHEIMFNAYYFRSTQEIMQAMEHEMMHLGQETAKEIFGEPGANGYHNREWAEAMLKTGLRPVNVKNPNLMTGQSVSDIVLDGGPFQIACQHYIKMGGSMLWTPVEEEELAANGGGSLSPEQIAARKRRAETKRKSNTGFSCPKCLQRIRGNWKTEVDCRPCRVPMERDKNEDKDSRDHVTK